MLTRKLDAVARQPLAFSRVLHPPLPGFFFFAPQLFGRVSASELDRYELLFDFHVATRECRGSV